MRSYDDDEIKVNIIGEKDFFNEFTHSDDGMTETPDLAFNRRQLDEKRSSMMRNSSNKKRNVSRNQSTSSSGIEIEEVIQFEKKNLLNTPVLKAMPGTQSNQVTRFETRLITNKGPPLTAITKKEHRITPTKSRLPNTRRISCFDVNDFKSDDLDVNIWLINPPMENCFDKRTKTQIPSQRKVMKQSFQDNISKKVKDGQLYLERKKHQSQIDNTKLKF